MTAHTVSAEPPSAPVKPGELNHEMQRVVDAINRLEGNAAVSPQVRSDLDWLRRRAQRLARET